MKVSSRIKAKTFGSRNFLFMNWDKETGEKCLVVNKQKVEIWRWEKDNKLGLENQDQTEERTMMVITKVGVISRNIYGNIW